MSSYEQRDNSGTIFVNDRKETEKHPDRSGKAMIGGKMYWVSGWLKDGPKGKYLSLAFKPMEEKPSISEQAQAKIRRPDPISSGLPPKRSIIPDDDMGSDSIPF